MMARARGSSDDLPRPYKKTKAEDYEDFEPNDNL